MKNILLFCGWMLAFQSISGQNVRFSFSVSSSVGTSTVSVFGQATTGSGNNMTGFTNYLYYDNTKATVANFNAAPITGTPYNWGTANESSILFQTNANSQIPIAHTGYFFYQNFDNNFVGINLPTTPILLFTVTFNIISGGGGSVYLASTTQVPPIIYFDAGLTSFPIIVVGSPSQTLPLDLISFDSKIKNDRDVELNWTTANEQNMDFFDVEKSLDATNWSAIRRVKATGSSNYAFDDNAAFLKSTTVYYRLKMVEIDQKYHYSSIKSEKIAQKFFNFKISPNPTSQISTFSFDAFAEGMGEIGVFDPLGKLIFSKKVDVQKNKNNVEIDLKNLPSGIYNAFFSFEKELVWRESVSKI
jgi:hypothetical protein